MSATLLVHPYPEPGQSADCYVRHLAAKNGYSSGAMMLKQIAGISGQLADSISLKQLELLTGNDPDVLSAVQLTVVEDRDVRHFRFHDLSLPNYHLRREEWICPRCYEECGYVHANWRVAWLPVCTKHRCALEPYPLKGCSDHVPEKFDLFSRRAANDETIPADVLEVQEWLEHKLFTGAASSSSTDIVSLIDKHLIRALRLRDVADLQRRKRRYPMTYFPLNYTNTMKFMSCLHSQMLSQLGS